MFHSKISCFGSSLDASEKEIKEFKGVRIEKGLNVDGFKFFRMLGKGAYAKVRVAAKKDSGELFAIKCYNKQHIVDKKAVITVIQERKLLSLVCHPFCIYLHWAFQTETELFLVMNLLPGGDLRFHLGKKNNFSFPKARFFRFSPNCFSY
jgi:serine/threonine protein kinase